MLTVSNFAHAQSAVETTAESSDFAPKQYSLSKNAADLKQAILNDIKQKQNGTYTTLSNLENLKFPIFAYEFSDLRDKESVRMAVASRATILCQLLGYSHFASRFESRWGNLGGEVASLTMENNMIHAEKKIVKSSEYTDVGEGLSYMFHKLNRQGRFDTSEFTNKGNTEIFTEIECRN